MSTAVRYTPQKKQEIRSRHQLADRLTEFGWVPVVPEDLGEDFIVHIYHDGRATGVNFFVQLKSVTNLYSRRKGDYVPYSFEVKDLLHWEQFTLPVILIIWDVKLREGRWVLIDDILKRLDQDYPSWKQQKTKTVYFPWKNTLDSEGILKLRRAIGKKIYPLIPSEKLHDSEVELTFNIKNEEDKRNWEKFNYHLDTGEEVKLKNINTQFDFSELYKIWFDPPQSGQFDVTLGARKSEKEFTTDISISEITGETHFLDPTRFKADTIGIRKKNVTISNKHQLNAPIHFKFVIEHPNKSGKNNAKTVVSIDQNNLGPNVQHAQKVLKFLRALAKGGTLRLTFRELNDHSLLLSAPPNPEIAPNPKLVDLIEKLSVIQAATGLFFKVPDESFHSNDVGAINEVFAMINQGKITYPNQSYKAEFLNQRILIGGVEQNFLRILLNFREQHLPIQFTFTFEDSEIQILGKKINTGIKVQHLVCNIMTPASTLQNAVETLRPDEALEVHFDNVEEIIVFPDWFRKEAKRISQLLADKFSVSRIYLFGSLAWGQTFSPETDIDLAVQGLNPEQVYKAIGYLEGVTNFPFDLVDIDIAPKSLQQRILMEGELLYEREPVAVSG